MTPSESRSPRRLVVLTGTGLEHHYVTNRLCAALPIEAVIVDERVRRPSLRRAFRGSPLGGASRIGLFVFRRLVRDDAAFANSLRTILGSKLTDRFTDEHLVVRIEGVNSVAARAAIAATKPDLLLIFGTSIVGDETLALARERTLNLHTGVSPRYRGTDCAFWPVVNAEPEWIGATVHECTADVDGGQIFAVERAKWEPSDHIHSLFARAVVCGADLYVDAVQSYLREGTLDGKRQDLTEGHEYRGYMRRLAPELRARMALRRGLLRRTRRRAESPSVPVMPSAHRPGGAYPASHLQAGLHVHRGDPAQATPTRRETLI